MQTVVRSKTLGVTGYGGRGTARAGPGRDLLSGSRGVPTPYRRTWDLGPHGPCPRTPRVQIVESVESTPDWEAGKREGAQNGEPLQDMGSTWRTWPPCVKGNAARLATSAPLRRNWRRLTATAEPGVTGSAGPQNPRRKPGRWRRIPARSGCG